MKATKANRHRITTGRDDSRKLPVFVRCSCGADVNFESGRDLARWQSAHLSRQTEAA